MNVVFAAMYWDGPESAAGVISIHKTEEGAKAAVEQHKAREKQDWRDCCTATDSEFVWSDDCGSGFSGWLVKEYEVKP